MNYIISMCLDKISANILGSDNRRGLYHHRFAQELKEPWIVQHRQPNSTNPLEKFGLLSLQHLQCHDETILLSQLATVICNPKAGKPLHLHSNCRHVNLLSSLSEWVWCLRGWRTSPWTINSSPTSTTLPFSRHSSESGTTD